MANCFCLLHGQKFTKVQVKEDLNFLEDQLKVLHPGLEIYNTIEEFEDYFDDLESHLRESYSPSQAYYLLAGTSEIIKDGHTLFYPNPSWISHANESKPFFPFDIYWDKDDLYIKNNYSGNNKCAAGNKILSFNGRASKEMMEELIGKMMKDGNNPNYAIWVLNSYFSEYYSYYFGHPAFYALELENEKGDKMMINIDGLKKDNYKNFTAKNWGKAIYLEDLPNQSTAVLTIKDWHKDVLKNYFDQNFKKAIKPILEEIKASNPDNLIIDLRGNQGGDFRYSKMMLEFLLDSPFKMVHSYEKRDKSPNYQLKKSKGPKEGIHPASEDPYQGKVFVLIDGGSFSNSGVFSSVLDKHGRATFVGEESGGSAHVLCADYKKVVLPNTKISVEISSLKFNLSDPLNGQKGGIQPDHEVKASIQDLLIGRDTVLEYTLQLIKGGM